MFLVKTQLLWKNNDNYKKIGDLFSNFFCVISENYYVKSKNYNKNIRKILLMVRKK